MWSILQWAAIGYTGTLTGSRSLHVVGMRTWLRDHWDAMIFRLTLAIIDLAFWATRIKQRECRRSPSPSRRPFRTRNMIYLGAR
jgi:hypothetical protein